MKTVLAIVGSTKFATDPNTIDDAMRAVDAAIERYEPWIVISGGAVGVDTFAADSARSRGIYVCTYFPRHPRWEPEGYKERNLVIATLCTHLVAIRHAESKTYGSGWTADRAEEMGKPVERITIG